MQQPENVINLSRLLSGPTTRALSKARSSSYNTPEQEDCVWTEKFKTDLKTGDVFTEETKCGENLDQLERDFSNLTINRRHSDANDDDEYNDDRIVDIEQNSDEIRLVNSDHQNSNLRLNQTDRYNFTDNDFDGDSD